MNRRGHSAAAFRSATLASLPWVCALLIVVSSLAAPIGEFDDSLPLIHGMLVQQGAVPTIDFLSFYPPLGPYVTAAVFHVLGRTIVATRILSGAIYLLVLILVKRLLARQFPRSGLRIAMTVLLLAGALGRAITLPAWPGFGVSAVALLVYSFSQKGSSFARLTLGLSGVLTGLALLYRVNFGGYVALVIAADLMISGWPIDGINDRARELKQRLFTAALFFVPLLTCFFVLCLGVYGSRLVAGISEFTLTTQRMMSQARFIDLTWSLRLAGALFFPGVWFILRLLVSTSKLSWHVLPALALCLGLLVLAVTWGDHVSVVGLIVLCQVAGVLGLHAFVMRLPRLQLGLLLFYGLQLHYYLSRADVHHLKFLAAVAILILSVLCLEPVCPKKLRNNPFFKRIELAGLVALIWVVFAPQLKFWPSSFRYGISLIADVCRHRTVADSERVLGSAPPGAAWASVYSNADELQALRYLRQVTTSADPIFVGVQDHSKVFYNNLQIYWLSDRPIGVREFQLETRIATEAAVQREIIHDIDQNHVKWVIIDRKQHEGDQTFARRAYSGSTLLDAFLMANFKNEAQFGQYALLRRATRLISRF